MSMTANQTAQVSLEQNQLSGRCDTEAVEWFIAHGREEFAFGQYLYLLNISG